MITEVRPGVTVEELPDTEASVPCEVLVWRKYCGKPAAYRVWVHCECAVHVSWKPRARFVCEGHLASIVTGWIACELGQQQLTYLGLA